jgi:hypothetical protein
MVLGPSECAKVTVSYRSLPVINERKILRCVVYTRKSSEHGLEQDFNSLHAQREAGEAYVKSQAAEGWKLVKTQYELRSILLIQRRTSTSWSSCEE